MKRIILFMLSMNVLGAGLSAASGNLFEIKNSDDSARIIKNVVIKKTDGRSVQLEQKSFVVAKSGKVSIHLPQDAQVFNYSFDVEATDLPLARTFTLSGTSTPGSYKIKYYVAEDNQPIVVLERE